MRGGKRRAFTLVEILTVIVITAVLVVALVVFIPSFINWTQQTSDKQTLTVLNDALTRWKTQGGSVNALTAGAPISHVLARLQTPVTWAGMTHQVMQTGNTYNARSLSALGNGVNYRFTAYGSYGNEPGGSSPMTYAEMVMADSPSSYYRLGESSGTTAVDSAGGNSGTYSNSGIILGQPGAIVGDVNTCADFQGAPSYVTAPQFGPTNISGDMSVELWINPSIVLPGIHDVYAQATTTNEGLTLRARSDRIEWYSYDLVNTTPYLATYTTTFSPSSWYHLVGTYSISNGYKLYLNGALVALNTATTRMIGTGSQWIGATNQYSMKYFTGCIDEVAIYPYVLSPAQILNHYNKATGN